MKSQDLRDLTICDLSEEDMCNAYRLLHWAADCIEHLEDMQNLAEHALRCHHREDQLDLSWEIARRIAEEAKK